MRKTTKMIAALGATTALGFAALPLSTFAVDPVSGNSASAEVTVTATVGSAIAIALDSATKSIPVSANSTATATTTVTVSTNDVDGYTLTVKDKDATTALVNGTYSIPTGTNITAGTSAWAIKGGDQTNYAAVPANNGTPITLKANGTSLAADEQTTVTYGVSTSASQAAGDYSDIVVYTATVK